ncbi:glycosyltransferase [Neolewinella sp.]|uniref:glycosyltransferase n=1 Tax=Neolewinella sp. TaxID=2993543 RepID=UPI003B522D01
MSSPSSPPARPVAFYVHHHGRGHANRTRLLTERWATDAPLHVFTSAPESFRDWTASKLHILPPDVSPDRDPTRDLLQDQVLHYAPVDLPGLQQRMAIIADWIAEHRPALFIVDLSVEIALFVRLCGCRTALVRLHGHRDDPAHTAAFRLADHLLAPFPPQLEDAHTPNWVREKTTYLGTFSRYDHRKETKAQCRQQLRLSAVQPVVTVVNGVGGGAQVQGKWWEVAHATPGWLFLLVGRVGVFHDPTPPNLRYIGFVSDTYLYLKAADVVMGSGGTNTMMEVGAARVPFLSMPEERPFGEQRCKMEALQRLGLTRIVPEDIKPEEWAGLLEEARNMDVGGWDGLPALSERFALG